MGRANGTARMTLDVPNSVLLLGWSPLFLKDGRAGRKKEHNDKREATHTRKKKRGGWRGVDPSTEW